DAQAAHAVLHGGLHVAHGDDGDAQCGTAGDVAVLQQILHDGLHGVHRNGEAQALGVLVGVFGVDDADQFPVGVEQAAAGVARADGRAGLHQGHLVAFHRDVTVQSGDDAVGDGAAQGAHGVAHGDDHFAHLHAVGIAQHSGGQAGGVDLQQGDVALLVAAHHGGGVGGVVMQGHGDLPGAFHHVVVGDDVAVGGEDDAAA